MSFMSIDFADEIDNKQNTDEPPTNPWTFGVDTQNDATSTNSVEDNTSNPASYTFGVDTANVEDNTSNPMPYTFGVDTVNVENETSTNSIEDNAPNSTPYTFGFDTTNVEDESDNKHDIEEAPHNPWTLGTLSVDTTNDNTNNNDEEAKAEMILMNDNDIDEDGRAAFLRMFFEQTKDQWCCGCCNNYNPITINKCEACDQQHKDAPNKTEIIKTPNHCKIQKVNTLNALYSYYNVLNDNDEILIYDYPSHPIPRYFPYLHDEKGEELANEGPEAWIQFDADNDDEENKIDDRIKTYREYKKRRRICHQQLNDIKKPNNRVMIAMAGDGSMGGQLGVGNGSITDITNNISPFPFILRSLADYDIKYSAAGIMSTAVVTNDNQIYVWGLNDKSELTINPNNLEDVDIGDDDDQLSPDIAYDRLYTHYLQLITTIYRLKNPQKLLEKDDFVEELLLKRKVGKIRMSYRNKEEVKQGALYDEDQIRKIIQQFEDKCRLEQKKKTKKGIVVKWDQEINITETAAGMHSLYIRVCDTYSITQRQHIFTPKASQKEMCDRKERKLNPYKYISDISDIDQSTLSCSYWTPANIVLPYKMVVREVSLGGTHMVVLDDLGQVWSSGTFTNDGSPIGHHFNLETQEIIRYQRTLIKISSTESLRDGAQRSRIGNGKNSKLPSIQHIASGVNHFLMLDNSGNIWTMGVSKLGQKWLERNTKRYLYPKRVPMVNIAKNKRAKKRIKFSSIACGNYHNVAVCVSGQLYSWGQNIWLQCGHNITETGYGNVVDHPRWVPFYKNDENIKMDYAICSVVAGEHMTVALDVNGAVWSCGRNACGALGRKTESEGIKHYGAVSVQTEVKPDLMRRVSDLSSVNIDWIGCGSVVWFAHNSGNGAVYTFGDASSGRAGIGQWKCARGRPVFDEHNLNTKKYEVTSAKGGCDHVIFTIKHKKNRKQRHRSMFPSNTNSRESSLSLDESNGSNNQMDNKDIGFNRFSKVPASNKILHRTQSRKRKREVMIAESLNEIIEGEILEEPEQKRRKLDKAIVKPTLDKEQQPLAQTDYHLMKNRKTNEMK